MFSLDREEAIRLIGRNVALANRQQFDEIVTVCNACYTTLRKGFKILQNDAEKIAELNQDFAAEHLRIERIIPVRHYLEVLHKDIPDAVWAEKRTEQFSEIRVAAYYGCQFSRPWGDIDHPEDPKMLDQFIRKVGFSPVDHSAKTLCCGASHGVQYQKECQSLVQRIAGDMRRKGAQWICTLCPLCQLNMDTFQDKKQPLLPVPYFTQLAGLSLGFTEKELGMNKLLIPISKGSARRKS
jgi:heterodisulfide reductase subunit B